MRGLWAPSISRYEVCAQRDYDKSRNDCGDCDGDAIVEMLSGRPAQKQRRNNSERQQKDREPKQLLGNGLVAHACSYEARRRFSVNPPEMSGKPKVLKTQTIYSGKVFSVRIDQVEIDGKQQQIDIVEHPGSFAIAAMPDARSLVLIRQYRHPADLSLWEIPAGTAEPNEECEAGARRELTEETGYSAASWELLGAFYPTPGFCTERVHLYVARGLQPGAQNLQQDESIEVRQVSFQDAWRMQASGDIIDMKTMVALLWLAGPPD